MDHLVFKALSAASGATQGIIADKAGEPGWKDALEAGWLELGMIDDIEALLITSEGRDALSNAPQTREARRRDIMRAVESAYGFPPGITVRCANIHGYREALEEGLLERRSDHGIEALRITEAGQRAIDESPYGLPLAIRETIFSRIPAPTAVLRCDVLDDADPQATIREWGLAYRISSVRFAELALPTILFVAKHRETGFSDIGYLVFPAGTTCDEAKADKLARLLASQTPAHESGSAVLRPSVFETDRIFYRDVSPEGTQRQHLASQHAQALSLRSSWNIHLGSAHSDEMRRVFSEALESDDLEVHVDQCEDDPGEICVRATGVDAKGIYWRNINLILLDPWFAGEQAIKSKLLANAVVDSWGEMKAAHRASLDARQEMALQP